VVESGPAPGNIDVGLTEGSRGGVEPSTTVQRGGLFVIRGVPPGKVYFFVNLEEGFERFYIKSITWNGKDLLREPLEIGAEEKIGDVKIVLSPQVATFTIRVRSILGEAVENVSLRLFRQIRHDGSGGKRSFSAIPTCKAIVRSLALRAST
jgi:hypothetical protein